MSANEGRSVVGAGGWAKGIFFITEKIEAIVMGVGKGCKPGAEILNLERAYFEKVGNSNFTLRI